MLQLPELLKTKWPHSHLSTASHLHYTSWIYTNHSANSSECGILLLVVPYISQTGAPDNRDGHI